VVTIGAPSDPEHVTNLFGKALDTLEKEGEAELNLVGRKFNVRKDFVEHLRNRDMEGVLNDLRKPILICHSPQDTIVGINNAAQIYMAAHHPKSYLSLDGADHLLTETKDSLYVGRMIAAWVDRYVERQEEELHTESQVVVSLSEPGFTSKVLAGEHRLIADEPKSVGGLDMGPSPYEYLSIGLGACTAMTIRMYTERKGWPIDEVNVHVSHGKHVHGEDTEHCGEEGAMIDTFFRKIEIIGKVDEAQRKRILQIADKCPVHKTLEASSVIKTEELTAT
jgi:putative redox protein